jgi:hypothetical protein
MIPRGYFKNFLAVAKSPFSPVENLFQVVLFHVNVMFYYQAPDEKIPAAPFQPYEPYHDSTRLFPSPDNPEIHGRNNNDDNNIGVTQFRRQKCLTN